MRKIILYNLISIDGFFAGANGEIDWHNVDDEFNEYAAAFLRSLDTLIFGRVTYQLMENYWPSAPTDEIADKMNSLAKIVFSRTLPKVEWTNSRLVKEINIEEISQWKQQAGKDMAIFGSGSLVSTFAAHGQIDEYRLIVNPVALGSGKPLFQGLHDRLNLSLRETKTFASGNVLLCYQPERKD
jgi:dihydrofolate reductase